MRLLAESRASCSRFEMMRVVKRAAEQGFFWRWLSFSSADTPGFGGVVRLAV